MQIADSKWLIVKDIPIDKGQSTIKEGGIITFSHGVCYLNGGMLPLEYQEDFSNLVMTDAQHRYIRPYNDIVGKSIIKGK